MALWTRADVRLIAPEMATVADSTVDAFIVVADRRIDSSAFGDTVIDVGAYLTAHLLKMAGYGDSVGIVGGGGGGIIGQVTGVTVGSVSVTGSAAGAGSSWLLHNPSYGLTRYGLMYAELLQAGILGVMVL